MVEITGTAKSDTIIGTQEDDILYGLGGNDKMIGDYGIDIILGGGGNDYIEGGYGDDQLLGQNGNDNIYGGEGFDYLHGGEGNDFLDPENGTNTVYGEMGNDTMVFHQGQPLNSTGTARPGGQYQGGDGNDILVFADNADIHVIGLPLPNQPLPGYSTPFFFANAAYVDGVEVFDASLASKLVYIGQESLSVKVIGTENDDQFFGRASDEVLVGGAGNDYYTIGNGSDTIISNFSDEDDIVFLWDASSGENAIYGFNGVGEDSGDLLQIKVDVPDDAVSEHSPITISEKNGYTVFDWEIGSLVVDAIGLVENFDYTIDWG